MSEPAPISLIQHLSTVSLPAWRFLAETSSTNDDAAAWVHNGAPDGALVVADHQTGGRGRGGRRWLSVPGSSLTLSLVFHPIAAEKAHITRFTALAALALADTFELLGLTPQIKWPNDVLINHRKVAGVLVEVQWLGDAIAAVVVGVGVNVTAEAIPHSAVLRFPATSVESELGVGVDRWGILATFLHRIQQLRQLLPTADFMDRWNNRLAFQGQTLPIRLLDGTETQAKVLQVLSDGRLSVQLPDGRQQLLVAGEIDYQPGREDSNLFDG